MKFYIVLLLTLVFSTLRTAAAPDPSINSNTPSLRNDTSKLEIRRFDSQAFSKYSRDPRFNYSEEEDTAGSWWNSFWNWVWQNIKQLFGSQKSDDGIPILRLLAFAVVIVLLVVIIVRYMGKDMINIFRSKPTDTDIPYSETLENIHEITFDEEIAKATHNKNYRLAVRLLYLSSLKHLNDAHLIHWQMEKTNAAYLEELKNMEQRQTFGILTKQFEYVWYGDFPVDDRAYRNISKLFTDFKNMLP